MDSDDKSLDSNEQAAQASQAETKPSDKAAAEDNSWAKQSSGAKVSGSRVSGYGKRISQVQKEAERDKLESEINVRNMFETVRARRGEEFYDSGGDEFLSYVDDIIASAGLKPKRGFDVSGKNINPVLSESEKDYHFGISRDQEQDQDTMITAAAESESESDTESDTGVVQATVEQEIQETVTSDVVANSVVEDDNHTDGDVRDAGATVAGGDGDAGGDSDPTTSSDTPDTPDAADIPDVPNVRKYLNFDYDLDGVRNHVARQRGR